MNITTCFQCGPDFEEAATLDAVMVDTIVHVDAKGVTLQIGPPSKAGTKAFIAIHRQDLRDMCDACDGVAIGERLRREGGAA